MCWAVPPAALEHVNTQSHTNKLMLGYRKYGRVYLLALACRLQETTAALQGLSVVAITFAAGKFSIWTLGDKSKTQSLDLKFKLLRPPDLLGILFGVLWENKQIELHIGITLHKQQRS